MSKQVFKPCDLVILNFIKIKVRSMNIKIYQFDLFTTTLNNNYSST